MNYIEYRYRDRASNFRRIMNSVSKSTPFEAISILLREGYKDYLEEKHYDIGKIEVLQILAKQEPTIEAFLKRLQYLEQQLKKGFDCKYENPIVLSTIHSSKGMEYDTVYMADVYDGRFPSSMPSIFCRSKDSADGEQEERRMFYVGITRAKNKLNLFDIDERESSYIEELFPEARTLRLQRKKERNRKVDENIERLHKERLRIQQEKRLQELEEMIIEREEDAKKAREYQNHLAEIDYMKRYNEVKDKFIQQETIIIDSSEKRWVQCEICHKIKEENDFIFYGGPNHINLGICHKCSKTSNTSKS